MIFHYISHLSPYCFHWLPSLSHSLSSQNLPICCCFATVTLSDQPSWLPRSLSVTKWLPRSLSVTNPADCHGHSQRPGARYSKLLTDSLSYGDRIHNDGCSKVWRAYVGTPNWVYQIVCLLLFHMQIHSLLIKIDNNRSTYTSISYFGAPVVLNSISIR